MTPADRLELEKLYSEYEIECYRIEVEDRQSARNREIEYVKAGRVDWMMVFAGVTGLGCFILMVISVIFYPKNILNNSLFHQLMGIIEGVSLTIFMYYYGSSKGSSDKNKMLGNK